MVVCASLCMCACTVMMLSANLFTHAHLPQEVKIDGGVFGLDESPETPKEVRSLERKQMRYQMCTMKQQG